MFAAQRQEFIPSFLSDLLCVFESLHVLREQNSIQIDRPLFFRVGLLSEEAALHNRHTSSRLTFEGHRKARHVQVLRLSNS